MREDPLSGEQRGPSPRWANAAADRRVSPPPHSPQEEDRNVSNLLERGSRSRPHSGNPGTLRGCVAGLREGRGGHTTPAFHPAPPGLRPTGTLGAADRRPEDMPSERGFPRVALRTPGAGLLGPGHPRGTSRRSVVRGRDPSQSWSPSGGWRSPRTPPAAPPRRANPGGTRAPVRPPGPLGHAASRHCAAVVRPPRPPPAGPPGRPPL